MRGFFIVTCLTVSLLAAAQEPERLDSVVVSASRAGEKTPVTFSRTGKEELRSASPAASLPMILEYLPSVVVSNEGGTGIGYSKMTVRGAKGSQINVTLNGITLNDAESQEVFWVNIPALGSILSSVQVQRGLGTTANGAGAFGASVNMSTASLKSEPSLFASLSGGAFGTAALSAVGSSGLLPSGLYFDIGFSGNVTNGYIRNAWGMTGSLYAAMGWLRDNHSLKLTYLMGDQNTGITWSGIPYAYLETDRTYNPEGAYTDADGTVRYYGNQSDNYRQQHLQLNYTWSILPELAWTTTVDWSGGYGYNEGLKTGKKLQAYGFPSDFTYNGVTASDKGNFIYRKTMDNDLLVGMTELRYNAPGLTLTGGAYVSRYDGRHYGELLWGSLLGKAFDYAALNRPDPSNNWYFNTGLKWDYNAFVRAEGDPLPWLHLYGDLQYRRVTLDMYGIDDDDDLSLAFSHAWNFFNPRGGVSLLLGRHTLYASASLGHREPGRPDIKEIIASNNLEGGDRELRPERMLDIEAGWRFRTPRLAAGVNGYLMEYRDMLLETGELSASGYAIKDNVDRSYRRGVETWATWMPWDILTLRGNLTLSTNKILDYTQYYASYDNSNDWNYLGQVTQHYDKVTMLMSPSVVGMAGFSLTPLKNLSRTSWKTTTLEADFKYVGKQYWDNTESAERCIPAWYTLNLSLSHEFTLREGRLGLAAYVRNVLNRMYYADAWVYRAYFAEEDSWYQEEGVFPQAPCHLQVKLYYTF